MLKPTNKPCNECPMRRASIPGYTGEATPDQLIDAIGGHGLHPLHAMPCHKTVDYEDPDWRRQLDAPGSKVRQCAGQAIYLANTCKSPKGNEDAVKGKPDHTLVFSSRTEFMEHHGNQPDAAEHEAESMRLAQRELDRSEARVVELRTRKNAAVDAGRVRLHVDLADMEILLGFAEILIAGYRRHQAKSELEIEH